MYTIDASNSWWGDPSGPNDPSHGPPDYNPNAPGSLVSDYVSYRPWATVPQTVEPPRSFALLEPSPGGVAFWDPAALRWSHSSSPDGGAISYSLKVDDDHAFGSPEVDISGLPDTSFAVTGLDTLRVYYWKVVAQDTHGGQRLSCPVSSWFRTLSPSAVPEHGIGETPWAFHLGQPVPNPFQDMNSIHFSLPVSAEVRLQVFDVGGRLVRTVMDDRRAPGDHVAVWDGFDMAGRRAGNGVYFYRFCSTTNSGVRRVVLIR